MKHRAGDNLETVLRRAAARLSNSATPQLDVRLIARRVLDLDDAGLIVEGRREVSRDKIKTIEKFVDRRAAGEPMAYILGEKEFYGLSFAVRAPVLCPRPDTETVIEAAQQIFASAPPTSILDLGAGSGCLLISLLSIFPDAVGIGVDKAPHAASLARENLQRHSLLARGSILCGDWMEALRGSFDLIVSNPPYIADGDSTALPPDIIGYEDPTALFAGACGLQAYEEIAEGVADYLSPGGVVILEIGEGQKSAVEAIAARIGALQVAGAHKDLAGRDRAVVFRRLP